MGNVIELATFKEKKKVHSTLADTFSTASDLDGRVKRIKESIKRINTLMQELSSDHNSTSKK